MIYWAPYLEHYVLIGFLFSSNLEKLQTESKRLNVTEQMEYACVLPSYHGPRLESQSKYVLLQGVSN